MPRGDVERRRRAARAHGSTTIEGYRKQWNAFIAPGRNDDSTPIHPAARRARDRQGAAGRRHPGERHRRASQLAAFSSATRAGRIRSIGSMGFGPMGFGVAGVLGAQFAAPDRPCVSVCGDGAFFMHASVLGTAVEYNLPVVWVVWNNFAYASIRGLQRGYLGGRELATDFRHPETGAPYNPDFAAMARSAGIDGVNVDRAGDLSEALRAAIEARRPTLINANIRADNNPGGAGVWELPGLGQASPPSADDTGHPRTSGNEAHSHNLHLRVAGTAGSSPRLASAIGAWYMFIC